MQLGQNSCKHIARNSFDIPWTSKPNRINQHTGHEIRKIRKTQRVHSTRRIVYSASCSWNFEGSFWVCVRLFGDYVGVIWRVFWKEFEGKLLKKQKKNQRTPYTLLFKIALNSLFIDQGDFTKPSCKTFFCFFSRWHGAARRRVIQRVPCIYRVVCSS